MSAPPSASAGGSSWMDSLLRVPAQRPVITLVVAALIVLLSAVLATRMQPVGSLHAMMNDRDPSAMALGWILQDFGSVDKLLLVASLPKGGPTDEAPLVNFANRLNTQIDRDPQLCESVDEIRFTRGGTPDDIAFFEEHVVPAGLYYLDDRQFAGLMQRLKPESMREQIRRNEELIAAPSPSADAISRVLQKDPLRLREFLGEALTGRAGISLATSDEPLVSHDGRSLLIIIAAREPATDLDFTKQFLRQIQSAANQVNADRLELEYSGSYAIAAASERSIRSDMIRSVVIAVVLMQVMFLIMHRRPLTFIVAFAPTAVAIVVAFGLHALIRPQLTPATAVVGAIIAGLGVDYSIHVISYYAQARRLGAAPPEAAFRSARELLIPTIAAAGTTFIGVFVISQSPVGALRDFSIIALIGLVGAMFAAFTILPALLVLLDGFAVGRRADASRFESRFTMVAVTSFVDRHRRGILALAALLWIAAVAFIANKSPVVPVESDLTAMHPRPNPALQLQEKIARDFDIAANSLLVHLQADSPEALVAAAYDIASALQSEAARGAGVRGVVGLSSLLPDPRTIESRSRQIAQLNVEQIIEDFHDAIDQSIFSYEAFTDFEMFLKRFLKNSNPPNIVTLGRYEHLTGTVLPRRTPQIQPAQSLCVIQLDHPLADRTQRDRAIAIIRAALAPIPQATLTGLTVISHDVERSITTDLARLSLIATAAVIIFLAFFIRNPPHLALALTPTAIGLTFVLAGFHFFNDGLNMINLVGVPLLMGIGDNFGIFVVDALRHQRKANLPASEFATHLAASARAIILTSITAILGFGSLMFTSTPAIQSLGRLTALGVSASLAGTLFVVMPITMLIARRMKPRPIA